MNHRYGDDDTFEDVQYTLEEGSAFLHTYDDPYLRIASQTFSNAWFKCHGCGTMFKSTHLDPRCPGCRKFYISDYPLRGDISFADICNADAREGYYKKVDG